MWSWYYDLADQPKWIDEPCSIRGKSLSSICPSSKSTTFWFLQVSKLLNFYKTIVLMVNAMTRNMSGRQYKVHVLFLTCCRVGPELPLPVPIINNNLHYCPCRSKKKKAFISFISFSSCYCLESLHWPLKYTTSWFCEDLIPFEMGFELSSINFLNCEPKGQMKAVISDKIIFGSTLVV